MLIKILTDSHSKKKRLKIPNGQTLYDRIDETKKSFF